MGEIQTLEQNHTHSAVRSNGIRLWTRSEPQPQAILAQVTSSAVFLTVSLTADAELAALRDFLGDFGDLVKMVGFRHENAGLTCVVGIRANVWDRVTGSPRPKQLRPVQEIKGLAHTAVGSSSWLTK